MQYTKKSKEQIMQDFICALPRICEDVKFGNLEIEIANGVPVKLIRGVKSIRFDIEEIDKNNNLN